MRQLSPSTHLSGRTPGMAAVITLSGSATTTQLVAMITPSSQTREGRYLVRASGKESNVTGVGALLPPRPTVSRRLTETVLSSGRQQLASVVLHPFPLGFLIGAGSAFSILSSLFQSGHVTA